jgi:hypothetical protein
MPDPALLGWLIWQACDLRSMDIFFRDPNEVPLPPEEVRILDLKAVPWPDRQRVQVYFETTPFQKRPSGEISIKNANQEELAFISIIETMGRKMEFTLHLRGAEPLEPFTLSAELFYYEQDEHPEGEEGSGAPSKKIMVDQRQISFDFKENEQQD